MATQRTSIHGQWSSRLVFILAATGSAVGLGNIWKFPYITGEHGGGAFVLVYLLCIALVGIPIMIAEVMLGRRGRQSPINTMRSLLAEEGAHRGWSLLGWSGMIAGFLILSYYSVIAGWALAYVFRTGSGLFVGATADGVSAIFGEFAGSPERLLGWHTLFMLMTMIVVARGVRSGLEQAVKFLMPALLVILLLLVGYAMASGDFMHGVRFLFQPDFSRLDQGAILVAMGHAFFTLSLGMGSIMVYGSYLPKEASIASSAVIIALADTAVALLAGMAIFPIVFGNGLEAGAGPSLIFQTLPLAFGQMPWGSFIGGLFFVLLVFAAWSSAISLIEPAVSWLVENRGWSRVYASTMTGAVTWALGIASIFSFSGVTLQDIILSLVGGEGEPAAGGLLAMTVFDILDYLTANIMLPLGGLFIALFAGHVMSRESVREELAMRSPLMFRLWFGTVRTVTPVLVVLVFLSAIGVIGGE